jgi:hypothetical protein
MESGTLPPRRFWNERRWNTTRGKARRKERHLTRRV